MVPPIPAAPQQCRWLAFATAAELEQAALNAIIELARAAISARGSFHIVLAGGTTPRRIYQLLRHAQTQWDKWHVYFGDERCLPQEHAERNSTMARQAWLDHVPIPAQQVHAMRAELGAERAAQDYAALLSGMAEFDLVLLGLGEDGHTASLFPNHEWGSTANAPAALAVHDAPKPPPERVSLSARRLSRSHKVIYLVTGESKRNAVRAWREGSAIPAAAIAPGSLVEIYVEAALL
jgi:6-phosphogluconolactonase